MNMKIIIVIFFCVLNFSMAEYSFEVFKDFPVKTSPIFDFNSFTEGYYLVIQPVYELIKTKYVEIPKIILSDDGGHTWDSLTVLDNYFRNQFTRNKIFRMSQYTIISFLNKPIYNSTEDSIIDYHPIILITKNKGLNWEEIPLQKDFNFKQFIMQDTLTGFIKHKNKILKTENGWNTNEVFILPDSLSNYSFINNKGVWLTDKSINQADDTLKIFEIDRSNNFNHNLITFSYHRYKPHPQVKYFFSNLYTGLAILAYKDYTNTELGEFAYQFYKTDDGGKNWNLKFSTQPISRVGFSTASKDTARVCVGTQNHIILTTDFGESWSIIKSDNQTFWVTTSELTFTDYNTIVFRDVIELIKIKNIITNVSDSSIDLYNMASFSPINREILINQYDKIYTLKIYSLMGQCLYEHNNVNHQNFLPIDASGWANGLYFVVLYTKNSMVTKKVFIYD